ncbi:SPOR domain-containing protein [Flavobacterium algicola]|uniref:SPOR domain-containing protein n=1 Tax=Flavobacterium algicola TaxID=556529 RepID=UPI001EFEB3EA|nr:SPOR domain-containing protein [Flavobacterium algicola]MCG9791522.1 SPOR domain-containing protein [Flavobacterium algicola]
MRILTFKNSLTASFLLCLTTTITTAQQSNTTLKQDSKFEQLLTEKRKINSLKDVNERYKIQVYTGNSEGAKKALYDCKQEYKELDGTMVFFTPNYKVWIGNFRTRLEAVRCSMEIKKKYPNMLIIKPQT